MFVFFSTKFWNYGYIWGCSYVSKILDIIQNFALKCLPCKNFFQNCYGLRSKGFQQIRDLSHTNKNYSENNNNSHKKCEIIYKLYMWPCIAVNKFEKNQCEELSMSFKDLERAGMVCFAISCSVRVNWPRQKWLINKICNY